MAKRTIYDEFGVELDPRAIYIPDAILCDRRLKSFDHDVLFYLLRWSEFQASCTASDDEIAAHCRCSLKRIRARLTYLSELGYIQADRIPSRTPRRITLLWVENPEILPEVPEIEGDAISGQTG